MGELIDMEGARALVADRVLWPRIRDFLWDFAPQVHESWWPSEDARWSRVDGRTEFNHPRLKAYLLSSLGVTPCFHVFPKDDFSRILLLDGATLVSLIKWIGALAYAEPLRCVTDGKVVRELKAALPGIYPEVFGYTAYFRADAESPAVDRRPVNAEDVISVGRDILSALLSHLPGSLLQRLALKLPKSFQPSDGRQPPTDIPTFGMRLIAKLFKLKFPEAYALCYS